jgi:hypothetical protein
VRAAGGARSKKSTTLTGFSKPRFDNESMVRQVVYCRLFHRLAIGTIICQRAALYRLRVSLVNIQDIVVFGDELWIVAEGNLENLGPSVPVPNHEIVCQAHFPSPSGTQRQDHRKHKKINDKSGTRLRFPPQWSALTQASSGNAV